MIGAIIGFIAFCIIIGAFSGSSSTNNNIPLDKKKKELEKEMTRNGLEEWQKKLVRKGDFEPFNFEEEDLDEDDYYHDDDDDK